MSIGGHHSPRALKDEWLTPPSIIEALGEFDLDPCAPIHAPWPTAKSSFDQLDDGLKREWNGRVWLNPPHGKELDVWLEALNLHGNGIALIFARTETKTFFKYVWGAADAILFIEGRLHFHDVEGVRAKANSGAPSCLVAYGTNNIEALRRSGIKGKFFLL